MDNDVIATHLESLDRRLAWVEQFLPTLATKDELQASIAPLATRAELQAAVAPLATKEDLDNLATMEELRELRRHMDVLNESLRGDIHLIAAHVASNGPKGNEP